MLLKCTCKTVTLWWEKRTAANFDGNTLTAVGTISREAPLDRATNISTTEGSKVSGEARNKTSFCVISKSTLRQNRVQLWETSNIWQPHILTKNLWPVSFWMQARFLFLFYSYFYLLLRLTKIVLLILELFFISVRIKSHLKQYIIFTMTYFIICDSFLMCELGWIELQFPEFPI